jgi:hypothetical protein
MMFSLPNVILTIALAAIASATQVDHIVCSTVTGYFLQDLNTTNATTFDYVCL